MNGDEAMLDALTVVSPSPDDGGSTMTEKLGLEKNISKDYLSFKSQRVNILMMANDPGW